MGGITEVLVPVTMGTVVIALWNVVKRGIMKGGSVSALQFLILCYAAATAIFGTIYTFLYGFALPEVIPGLWTAVALGAAANVFIQFFNTKAASIDKGEVSLTAPLQAMTPGLITGLALILGEYPSRIGVAGIALMIAGSYVLLWEKTPSRWYEYFAPFKRIALLTKLGRLDRAERNKTIVVSLALGSACMGTIGLLFDGLYVRRALTMQGLILASMVLVAFLLAVYAVWYIARPDAKVSQEFYAHLRRVTLLPIILMGIFWVLHVLAIYPAYNQTFIGYVGTLKRLSILMSVVLGFLFFKEEEFKKRFWAAVLIMVGAVLIGTDELPARLATRIEGLGF